jgi:hypothetical protein
VSGVVALLVERKPTITPDEVRALLMKTASAFFARPKGEEDGAGLVDRVCALQALTAATTSELVPLQSGPRPCIEGHRPAETHASPQSIRAPLKSSA